MFQRLIPVLTLLLTTGCGAAFGKARCASAIEADMLVMGDSILFYNAPACASAGDVAGKNTGLSVHIAARTGAKVNPDGFYVFGDIREQYVSRPWQWVVLGGGLNDLNQDCDCGACSDVLDSIVSEDGRTGDVPALIERARADGARVVLVGYAEVDPEAKWGFGVCNATADVLESRYRALAALHDDVVFVDPSDVMSLGRTPDAYVRDGVHPSEFGSALMGRLVAEAIQAEGTEQTLIGTEDACPR